MTTAAPAQRRDDDRGRPGSVDDDAVGAGVVALVRLVERGVEFVDGGVRPEGVAGGVFDDDLVAAFVFCLEQGGVGAGDRAREVLVRAGLDNTDAHGERRQSGDR